MRRTVVILMAAMFVLGGVTACGSSGSSDTAGGDAASAEKPADTSAGGGTTGAGSDADECAAVVALRDSSSGSSQGDESTIPPKEDLERLRSGLPAELRPVIDTFVELAGDPAFATSSEKGDPSSITSGSMPSAEERAKTADAYTRLMRAGYSIDTWWRHHCAPPAAASAWCDTLSQAELDRLQHMFDALGSASDVGEMMNSITSMGQVDEEYFATLRASAPADLAAAIDAIVSANRAGQSGQELDDAAEQARKDAETTLHDAVARDCGDTLAQNSD